MILAGQILIRCFPERVIGHFRNVPGDPDSKRVDASQIAKCYKKYQHIKLDSQYMLSSDGHKCLSSPELFIEEYFISKGISHIKEGDLNKDSGKRLTEYPFDEELNSN